MSPRPRTFDENAVLWAAVDAFRKEGYAGLSMTKIERATGLAASSIYNAYGDKAGLHRRAVAHYNAAFMAPRLERFAGPTATLDDLERLFTSLFEPPLNDGYGCLLINTATEFGPSTMPDVAAGLRNVAGHIDAVLLRELGDAEEGAALMLLYQGVLISIRAGLTTDDQLAAIRREFDRLRRIKDRHQPPKGN